MRSLLPILSFVLLAQSVFAQKAIIKEIREIAPYSKKQYIFPLISIPENKHAENKINKKLQEETLNLDTPGYKKVFSKKYGQYRKVMAVGYTQIIPIKFTTIPLVAYAFLFHLLAANM